MNVVMPLFALLMVLNFRLDPAVTIALVALSVSPVPPFFPKTALKAGGEENYTVGLLVAVGLLAIIVVPVTMAIFQRVVYVPLQMPVRDVAVLVLRTIVVPLLAGIAIRAFAPAFAGRTAKPIGTLATVLLVLSVLAVLFGSARAMLSLIGNGTILACVAFALVGLIVGYLFGGPDKEKRRVLSLATAARHPGMAAAIAHINFPDQKLALPAIALYLIVSGILSGLASRRITAHQATEETRKAA
jgi:BASS family bile acid:Na+ symporter